MKKHSYAIVLLSFLIVSLVVPLYLPKVKAENGRWTPYAINFVTSGDSFRVTAEQFEASLPLNIQSGTGIVFNCKGYWFTYKLSGGKMQWTDGSKTKSISAIQSSFGVADGNKLNYSSAFLNTNIHYLGHSYGIKEHFVLSELPENKDVYPYLEYTGELSWSDELSVWVNDTEYPSKTFSTSSKVEFKNEILESIFYLPSPQCWDSAENISYSPAIYDVKVSEDKIQYGLKVPYEWLETVVFPVYIDPWISPTGHNDPNNQWILETNAYDDNLGTAALDDEALYDEWGKFLELTHSAITSDKIRYNADYDNGKATVIDVDVYTDTWVDVYQGSFADETWEEKTFTEASITAARVRFYGTSFAYPGLYEFDFWEVEGGEDSTAPTYSNVGTNTTVAGNPCRFSTKWTDETGLATTGGFIFGTNNTGTFTNETWSAFSANPDWSNKTKTLNSTVSIRIEWQIWANDTSNNWNTTGLQYFVVTTIKHFYGIVTSQLSLIHTSTSTFAKYSFINPTFSVNKQKTGIFSRYSFINPRFTITKQKTIQFEKFGSVTQQVTTTFLKALTFNIYGSLTQQLSINHERTWTFKLFPTVTSTFTIDSIAKFVSESILNFFGSVTQQFTVTTDKSVNFKLYSPVNPVFNINKQKTMQVTRFGSVTQQITLTFERAFTFNIYSGVTQQIGVNHQRAWSFKLFPSVTSSFTIESMVETISGTLLNFFGSVTQTFTVKHSSTWSLNLYARINQLFGVDGWTDLAVPAAQPSGIGPGPWITPSMLIVHVATPLKYTPSLVQYIRAEQVTLPINITIENNSPYSKATLFYRVTCLDTNRTVRDWSVGEPRVIESNCNTSILVTVTIPIERTLEDNHYKLEVRLAFHYGDITEQVMFTVSKNNVRTGAAVALFGVGGLLLIGLMYGESKPKKEKALWQEKKK